MALITRPRRIDSSIDLTPLIDVVFQLLIFLMVSSQFAKPEAIVDLPQAQEGAAVVDPRREKLSLAIEADGRVVLDNEPVKLTNLGPAIRKRIQESGTMRLEIRGDQVAQFGVFVEVMETARTHGIESMGVVMKREKGATDAP